MSDSNLRFRTNELLQQDLQDMYLGKIIFGCIAGVSLLINVVLLYLLVS